MEPNPMPRSNRPNPLAHAARYSLTAIAIAALAACANFSGIEPIAQPLHVDTLGLKNLDASKDADHVATDDSWWQAFGDSQLNALVAKALQDNPTLKIAQARLARTQAASATVQSENSSQVTGSLDLQDQLYSANYIGSSSIPL